MTIEHPELHVLLVADNLEDRRLIVETLGTLPDVVLASAGSVDEATRHLQTGTPTDAILLDLGLPGSNEVETYHRVQTTAPDVPVIVLSRDADDGPALQAVASGAEDFVVKGGTDPQGLRRVLRHAVERRALTNRLAMHLRQRDGLLELGDLTLAGAPQEALLTASVRIVTTALGVDHAVVLQLDEDDALWLRASTGWDSDRGRDHAVAVPPQGLVRTALATPEAVVIDDVPSSVSIDDPHLAQLGVGSAIAVAIPNGTGPWGVLGVCTTRTRAFTDQDAQFLTAAAGAISTANQRSAAEMALVERLKEMRGLIAVQRAVQDRSTSADAIGPIVVHEVRRAMAEAPELLVELFIDEGTWRAGGGPDTGRHLHADVCADGQPRGRLTAYHADDQPFLLPPEQELLDGVAETLGLWLERQDSARALHDRERQLSFLLSQLPGSVWTTDTEMRFTRSVGRGLARLGVVPDEVVGSTVAEFLGPAGAQAVAAHARALQGERVAYTFGGHDSWQAFVEPMLDEDGDTITGVIGIALDHTDLQNAQSEAAESRQRLQGVFDGALEGFLLVDDDGRYVDVNPAFCELTGYPARCCSSKS